MSKLNLLLRKSANGFKGINKMLIHKGDKDNGLLSYMELTDLEFIPRRMYYITHTPKGEIRGNHGHYKDQQYLFCVQGQIKVTLISKEDTVTKTLNAGELTLLDRMVWSSQEYMTGDDILLVLCSTKFDEEDYFYDKGVIYD